MFLAKFQSAPEPSWPLLLARLAAGRSAVSVTVMEGQVPRGSIRVRILAASGDEIIVGCATSDAEPPQLGMRDIVSMTLGERGEHWRLRLRGAGLLFHAEANGDRRPAARLLVEDAQAMRQKRSLYRVELTGLGLAPALLKPLDPERAGCRAVVEAATASASGQPALSLVGDGREPTSALGQAFRGEILDLSGGGMAIRTRPRHEHPLRVGDRLSCTVDLPMIVKRFAVPARVCHLTSVSCQSQRLGVSFEFSDEPADRRIVDDICRFSTWLQAWEARRGQNA